MKKCPNCHSEYEDELVFCSKCGTKLVSSSICPKCGKEVKEDAAFCPYCGESLKQSKEPEEVVPVVHEKEEESGYTDQQICRYKEQLANYQRRKTNFSLAGGLLLSIGIFVFILCLIILLVNLDKYTDPSIVGLLVLAWVGLSFSFVAIDLGIVFLIVANAVFNRKISNRERILREYNSK